MAADERQKVIKFSHRFLCDTESYLYSLSAAAAAATAVAAAASPILSSAYSSTTSATTANSTLLLSMLQSESEAKSSPASSSHSTEHNRTNRKLQHSNCITIGEQYIKNNNLNTHNNNSINTGYNSQSNSSYCHCNGGFVLANNKDNNNSSMEVFEYNNYESNNNNNRNNGKNREDLKMDPVKLKNHFQISDIDKNVINVARCSSSVCSTPRSPNNKSYNNSYNKVKNLNNRFKSCGDSYNNSLSLKRSLYHHLNLNSLQVYWKVVSTYLTLIAVTANDITFNRLTTFCQSISAFASSDLSSSSSSTESGAATSSCDSETSIKGHKVSALPAATVTSATTSTLITLYSNNNSQSNTLTSVFSSIFFLILLLIIIITTTSPFVAGSTIPPPKIVHADIPQSERLDSASINQEQQLLQRQPLQLLQSSKTQYRPHNHHSHQQKQHEQPQQLHHREDLSQINEVYSGGGAGVNSIVHKLWANTHSNINLNDIANDSNDDSGDGDAIIDANMDDEGDDDDDIDSVSGTGAADDVHHRRTSSRAVVDSTNSKISNDDIIELRNYHYHRRREANDGANNSASLASLLQPVALPVVAKPNSSNLSAVNSTQNSTNDNAASRNMTAKLNSKENANTTTTTAKPTVTTTKPPPCEPKVLEKIPPDPLFDVEDICLDAAKEFAEFISTKSTSLPTSDASSQAQFSSSQSQSSLSSSQSSSSSGSGYSAQQTAQMDEIRRKANHIANEALQMDENLLAFAIASPSIHIAVVKFRDNVTLPSPDVNNRGFLSAYWRELGLAWNNSDGTHEWGAPFRDCNALPGRWLWPFRISAVDFGYKTVATAFIAADIDLCNDNLEDIFGRKHNCDRETTFCLMTGDPVPSIVNRDGYTCICRDSFYLPNSTTQGFRSELVESLTADMENNYTCVPCPGGCFTCDQNGVCLMGGDDQPVSMELLFKASVGSVLGACMLCCLVLAVIVFKRRKSKAIATGMWTVLETIVLGILLLYGSVALHFLPASTTRCLLEPWCRELGFMTCYGAIILKLYRHLVEFRTRKAHRWVLRDVDLLKYLGTMVFAVVCYMSAFTASSIDLIENADLLGLQEVQTNTCVSLKWEYVTQISELLIICFGLHLAFASRNANTQFRERQFLVAALSIEFIVSSSFYILRVLYLPELSPGAIFLALFVRSQLTNTVTLGLVFLPKLWYQHKQVCSLAHDLSFRLPVDAFKGSHDTGHHLGGGYAGLCLGDPDIGELTISEMSPEDIRAELKRLYTQLEILKNKTLRQDNPHISKRRGGRKAGHRRFSLQALSSKHRNKHHDIEITEAEPSRTPEDSVCSAEGPTDTYAEISGISHSMLSHSMVSHSK